MTFDDYWQRLVEKNPGLRLDDTVMKITVRSFKSSLRQAYEVAKEHSAKQNAFLNDLLGRVSGK